METTEIIKQFIVNELVPDHKAADLDEDQSLLESGILDSLGIMKLVAFIETKFKVEIADDELIPENFETLSALARFISQKD